MPSFPQNGSRPVTAAPTGFAAFRLFLVGGPKQWGRAGHGEACLLRSEAEVVRGFSESPRDSVWIARTPACLSALAAAPGRSRSDRRLLVFESLPEVTHHVLATWFRYVVVAKNGISVLPLPDLLEVLLAPNRDELFLGGAYDRVEKSVILYRGNMEPLVVPAAWFHSSSGAGRARVELDRLSVTDHGQTLCLGDHEIAAEAVLYEFDREYRKNAKRRALASDDSLGGAIRRLRLQKGLTQSDFGIPQKTIARIERGEVSRPQEATLRRIAKRLGVSLEALRTY